MKFLAVCSVLVGLVIYWLTSSEDPAAAEYQLTVQPPPGKLFSREELARHTTVEVGLYLAILGQVFDVSTKPKMYGGGYSVFLGKDASRAFATGKFQEDQTDEIMDFDPSQVKGLLHWRGFYHKNYTYKGVVEGAFYDSKGAARKDKAEWLARQFRAAVEEEAEKKRNQERHPDCNKRWSK